MCVAAFRSVSRLLGVVDHRRLLLGRVFNGQGRRSFQQRCTLRLARCGLRHVRDLVSRKILHRGNSFLRVRSVCLRFFRRILRMGRRVGASFIGRRVDCLGSAVSCCRRRGRRGEGAACLHAVGHVLHGVTLAALHGIVSLGHGVSDAFGGRPGCRVGGGGLIHLSRGQQSVRTLVQIDRRLLIARRSHFFHQIPSSRLILIITGMQVRLGRYFRGLVRVRGRVVDCLGQVRCRGGVQIGVHRLGCLGSRFRLRRQASVYQILVRGSDI